MRDLDTIFVAGKPGLPSLVIHVTVSGVIYEHGPITPMPCAPPLRMPPAGALAVKRAA